MYKTMKKCVMFAIAAVAFIGCNSGATKSSEGEATPTVVEATSIRACVAELGAVGIVETYTSEVLPFKENDIMPAAAGLHIDEIRVDVGDVVRAGQVIVTLDQTTLRQQELALATVRDSYNRMVPVHEAGGISDQQITEIGNQLELQTEVVENLRRNSVIESPISGVVTARNYEPGDLFAAMPILHIMQIDRLKVMVNVSEQYYHSVSIGQEVDINVDIIPGRTFTGRVSRISPALDAATRTFAVEITIPNTDDLMRPGMYARATFTMGERMGVLVDDVAVQKQAGSSERYVYVIKDGVAEYRLVQDGRRIGSKIEIISGLEAGEVVATTSFTRLMSGKPVVILEDEPTETSAEVVAE